MSLEKKIYSFNKQINTFNKLATSIKSNENKIKLKIINNNKKFKYYPLLEKIIEYKEKKVIDNLEEIFIKSIVSKTGGRLCFGGSMYPTYTLRGKGLYYYQCQYMLGLVERLDDSFINDLIEALKPKVSQKFIKKASKYLNNLMDIKNKLKDMEKIKLSMEVKQEGLIKHLQFGDDYGDEKKQIGITDFKDFLSFSNLYYSKDLNLRYHDEIYIVNDKFDKILVKKLKDILAIFKETNKEITKLSNNCKKLFAFELSLMNL